MIRAIYRWQVQPGEEESFIAAWSHGTRAIRGNIPGAHGSVLVRSQEAANEFIAVARWESLQAWQDFSVADLLALDPEAFRRLEEVSTLLSTEVGEEIADLAIEDDKPCLSVRYDHVPAYADTCNHSAFMRPYPGLLEVWHARPSVGLVGEREDYGGTRSPVNE